MFSSCPSVRSSVRLSVRSSVTNIVHMIIFLRKRIKRFLCKLAHVIHGKDMKRSTLVVMSHEAEGRLSVLAEASFSTPWVEYIGYLRRNCVMKRQRHS